MKPPVTSRPSALSTRRYPFVWGKGVLNGYSSTRVSLWDSLMFGRLAMGFANVRAGTRVLMLVLVQAVARGGGTRARGPCGAGDAARGPSMPALNTKEYSSTYLAMGFANVRAGTQKRRVP